MTGTSYRMRTLEHEHGGTKLYVAGRGGDLTGDRGKGGKTVV